MYVHYILMNCTEIVVKSLYENLMYFKFTYVA